VVQEARNFDLMNIVLCYLFICSRSREGNIDREMQDSVLGGGMREGGINLPSLGLRV
jgi:hypothetical protein